MSNGGGGTNKKFVDTPTGVRIDAKYGSGHQNIQKY